MKKMIFLLIKIRDKKFRDMASSSSSSVKRKYDIFDDIDDSAESNDSYLVNCKY